MLPHTPATLIPVELRAKIYQRRNEFYPPFEQYKNELYPRPSPEARKKEWTPDPGGQVREIISEIPVGPACAKRLSSTQH